MAVKPLSLCTKAEINITLSRSISLLHSEQPKIFGVMVVLAAVGLNIKIFYFQVPGHMAVYINEPKLSDFKVVLLQEGMQAEFGAGALICNETVAVRRVGI